MTLRLLLLKKRSYKIKFSFITKTKAVNRMKKMLIQVKKVSNYDYEKYYYNDVKYYTRDYDLSTKISSKKQKKCMEKVRKYYGENKRKGYKKWFVSDTTDCLKREKEKGEYR